MSQNVFQDNLISELKKYSISATKNYVVYFILGCFIMNDAHKLFSYNLKKFIAWGLIGWDFEMGWSNWKLIWFYIGRKSLKCVWNYTSLSGVRAYWNVQQWNSTGFVLYYNQRVVFKVNGIIFSVIKMQIISKVFVMVLGSKLQFFSPE